MIAPEPGGPTKDLHRPRSGPPLAVLLGCLLLAGCSGTGYGNSAYGHLDISIGTATTTAIQSRTQRILSYHGYEISRQDIRPDYILIETQWRVRKPFEDELALGATTAQTRLLIRAGPVRGSGSSLMFRSVQLGAENLLQSEGGTEQLPSTNTKMFKAFIRKLGRELEAEYYRESRL